MHKCKRYWRLRVGCGLKWPAASRVPLRESSAQKHIRSWRVTETVSVGDCACPVRIQGCISVTQIVLSVWLSQQRECVTVIWTAETRRGLMFAHPPTQICLRSRARAAQSKGGKGKKKTRTHTHKKKHLREMSSTGNDPCLFSSSKSSENTLAWISQICVFGRTCESTNRYARAQTAIWNEWAFTPLKCVFRPFTPRPVSEGLSFSWRMLEAKSPVFSLFFFYLTSLYFIIWHLKPHSAFSRKGAGQEIFFFFFFDCGLFEKQLQWA